MKIDSVDFFYLSMPEIQDIGDGSQDALLVRLQADGLVGWGECEASPLVSIAAWVCPMSHGACKPVSASILGQEIHGVQDILRLQKLVRQNSLDLLQADHTLSGIDIALWDLLGKKLEEPVWKLLGYKKAQPKLAYASQLFGNDPQATLERAREVRAAGFQAAKFGWGPYGRLSVEEDAEQVRAAREGLGDEAILLVDAGTVWIDDLEAAKARLPALEECRAAWLEEPFISGALDAYRELARSSPQIRLAGGEGCHEFYQAKSMIDFGCLGYIQIDAGRIGGISPAFWTAQYAHHVEVIFVNHTFTTPLALSASIQPYAGLEGHHLCEYPAAPSSLARELTLTPLTPDASGWLRLPEAPGLGITVNPEALKKYLVDVEIRVRGRTLYQTPRTF